MQNLSKIFIFLILFLCCRIMAQAIPEGIEPGNLRAHVGIGFSYELLHDPTSISFDYPEGKASFNVPIALQLPSSVGDILSQTIDTSNAGSSAYQPQLKAGQQMNLGFHVNVPMLGGVCSFAYTNNVDIDYSTFLGNSNVTMDTTIDLLSMALKGYINVPLNVQLGWRTMTFGYAIKPARYVTMAVNLNRHMFHFTGNANVSIDLLGNMNINMEQISIAKELDYSSEKLYGYASGDYEASSWSPTFGLKIWRLGLTSRFGIDAKAKGNFDAKYTLPFFIDPQTFQSTLAVDNMASIQNDPSFLENLFSGKTDSVVYHSVNDASWKLPQGHTVTFDIINNKLYASYTKIIGDIELKHIYEGPDKDINDTLDNKTDLDLGISVDNIILLGGKFKNSQFTVGVFTMDFRVFDNDKILSDAVPQSMQILGGPMLPILSLGSSVGGNMRMILQLDVLPLPSFKTGVIYNF